MQKIKNSPEVRAYIARKKREYRARKKAREAEAAKQPASLTPTTPLGAAINGDTTEHS